MTGDLNLISLFDGIGGFPLAFARAGVPTVATCEIDQAAAGVTAEHFPSATRFSDVTELTTDDILATGFDPARGVLTAGWPCTDLSLAGLRLGLGGARSGLVGEVFRLLAGLRPRWVVLENVPGLLSSVCPCPGGGACADPACAAGPHVVAGGACGRRTRTGAGRCVALHGGGMGTVLGSLVERGYGVAYRVLDASGFGVPQPRRRVVIVGRLGDWAGPVEVLLEPESGGGRPASGGATRSDAAGVDHVGTLQGGDRRRGYRVDAESAASGLLIADNPRPLARPLTAREGKGPDSDMTSGNVVAHALTAEGADASEDGTGRGTPITAAAGVRRLTPVECERLQGYPDGWTATSAGRAQADAPRYRQLGNSIAVPVFEWVARRIVAVDGAG